jgi:citrate synthase
VTYPTSLGTSTADTIRLLGRDLSKEMIGQISFGELSYWLITLHKPTPGQLRLFESVLVALADHGFTPTAIAARMTFYSAPDALQGALAAGLLGGGSRYLGVTEDTGRFLAGVIAGLAEIPDSDDGWDTVARLAVRKQREAGKFTPGIGHPVHKTGDPRVPVIQQIARDEGVEGPHLKLFAAIGRTHGEVLGRTLPLNGAGVCGAALADLGLPPELLRGVALLARCAGLVGQLAEEMRSPIAPDIYMTVDRNAEYISPAD